MRPYLIIIFFFICSLGTKNSNAQKKHETGFFKQKVPRSERKSIVSISKYLTKNISNDSLKVVALASWMVTRYKYDYKALKSGDWRKRSTEKMLKKRKALCGGFSDMFNELCLEAGINSETVIGYTKTWNYEPYDSLIRAEHAWNVVMVDGEWRLIDLSWSTGYTVQKKQRFRKLIYMWFNIPYKIKFKFVNKLTYKYMFTHPKEFIKSHAPLQPYWQLMDTLVPIKAFEMGRTSKYLNSPGEKEISNFKQEIARFRQLSDKEKHLKGAQQAFNYNKKNHRILGLGYFNYTTELQNEIDPELSEEIQIEKLDSCIPNYKIAKNYYKDYLKDTNEELKRRNTRNKRFKKHLIKENKIYIHQHKNTSKAHKKSHYKSRVQINKKKGLIRKYKRRSAKVNGSYLKKVKRPTKENGAKIAKAKMYIVILNELDSIIAFNQTISLKNIDESTSEKNITKDTTHIELEEGYNLSRLIAKGIKPWRFYYNEYTAPWIDSVKNSIGENYLINEQRNQIILETYDSLLLLKDSIVNFYDLTFIHYYHKQLKSLKGLKKSSLNDMNEEQDYDSTANSLKANYQKIISVYDSTIEIHKERLPELNKYIKLNKLIVKHLKREKKIEYKRFRHLARHYRKIHIFYKRQGKYLKRMVTKRLRTVKQEITYLKKQIKIREAKLKKDNNI